MQIKHARLIPYRLPLQRPWRTSRGTLKERQGWLVALETEAGLRGCGDCAPLPVAGTENREQAKYWLSQQMPALTGDSPRERLAALPIGGGCPAARCALESALLDLISQAEGVSLRHWLNPQAAKSVPVNANIGALDGQVGERSERALAQGFDILKLKLGLDRVGQELARLEQLAASLPPSTRLRLDANGAWDFAQASAFLQDIEGLPVESIEEPLSTPETASLTALQAQTHYPLAIDESLPRFELERLLQHPPVRRLIIKPMVQGGLLSSLRLAQRAAESGMEALVTSSLESAVGIQAAAQLAAAIGGAEQPLAHGLATSDWLARDLAQPPQIIAGQLLLNDVIGLGLRGLHNLESPQ